MTPAAIVLAGGAGSRFGGDKLLAVVRGRPLLHHALLAVDEVADPVVLVLSPRGVEPPLPDGLRARVLVARDPEAHGGPLAGLLAGVRALPAGTEAAILVAGDMPALVPAVLAALLDALGDGPGAVLATLQHEPAVPLPAAIVPGPVGAAAVELLAAGRRSLRALGEVVPTTRVDEARWRALDPLAASLLDVDTPADLLGR